MVICVTPLFLRRTEDCIYSECKQARVGNPGASFDCPFPSSCAAPRGSHRRKMATPKRYAGLLQSMLKPQYPLVELRKKQYE